MWDSPLYISRDVRLKLKIYIYFFFFLSEDPFYLYKQYRPRCHISSGSSLFVNVLVLGVYFHIQRNKAECFLLQSFGVMF